MTRKASGKTSAARKPAATKTSRTSRQEAGKGVSDRAMTREKQIGLFEKAMKLFHSGDFRKARDLFSTTAEGPNREMAHSARVHHRVCERRLGTNEPQLPTADDHYNYAIALINRREARQALQHLEEALQAGPGADHVHYAMAICLAMLGELDRAAEELSQAIVIQPRNRTAARNDPDIQPFASAPQIKSVLFPERAT